MTLTENKRSALKIVSVLAAAIVMWTSAFSVSAQTISDDDSINTETQVSDELLVLPNGDTLTSDSDGDLSVVEGVTVDIKVGAEDYKSYDVPKSTVGDALDHANIRLGEDDTVNKSLKAKVYNNTKIKVNRVTYKQTVKTEKVKYKTTEKGTNKLYVGQSKVKSKGKNGTKQVTYTTKVVNGKETKTYVAKTKVTKKAKNKVVLVGTKRRNYTMYYPNSTSFKTTSKGGAGTIVDHNGKTIAYSQVFTGSTTAYTAGSGALTSVGEAVHIGGVAVNPNMIPYGSKLYIQSSDGSVVYGYAVANDTGGFINDGYTLCDVFYPSYSACVNFGRRTMSVYVLK